MFRHSNKALVIFFAAMLSLGGCDSDKKLDVESDKYIVFTEAKEALKSVASYDELGDPDVIEFFTYGCSHCQTFAPLMTQWEHINKDRAVAYIPVVWNDTAILHAKLFYYIKDMPEFEVLHQGLYDLVSTFSRTDSIDDQKVMFLAYLQEQGMNPIEIIKALDSNQFEKELEFSAEMVKVFDITGTPNVVVNSHYKVNNSALKKLEEILITAEQLMQ